MPKPSKPDSDSEDFDTMQYLLKIFEKFEGQEKNLTKLGKKADQNIENMMNHIRKEKVAIFDHEDLLYQAIDGFKKVMRHTDQLIIDIDLRRQTLSQPERLAEEAFKHAELLKKHDVVPTTITAAAGEQAGGGDYGLFRYLGERKRMGTLEKITQLKVEPQLTESTRQTDFMNYAKDIPPELNKLYDWLGGTLLRIKRFPYSKTREVCYSQLRDYLEKLSTMVMGFSGAIIELRKELVSQRQVAYAQASFALQQAKYMAQFNAQRGIFPLSQTSSEPL